MRHQIIVKNSLDELEYVRRNLRSFLNQTFDPIETNRIILSTEEALANILEHAFPEGSEDTVEIELQRGSGYLTVILRDRGPVFNPLTLPPVNLEAAGASKHDGGLGVFLFTTLMEVEHRAREGGGNELIMKKKLPV